MKINTLTFNKIFSELQKFIFAKDESINRNYNKFWYYLAICYEILNIIKFLNKYFLIK